MASLAVIGLGAMGSRIARRLIAAGHDVAVWNRSREKADELAAEGATVAATPQKAAARADAVITMVADPRALRQVTEGAEGVVAGLRADATLIEMSTAGPPAVRRLVDAVGDGRILDAPVLGSLTEVDAGTLKVFVGGPDQLVERWRPLLSDLGQVLHVGPLGAGAAAKLVANSTLLASVAVLGEALALADKLGLSTETAFDVLATTPIAAQAERRRETFSRGEFPLRFRLGLAGKDADLIAEAGADLRLAAATRSWIGEAEEAGWGERDYSELLAWITGRR